MSVEPILTRLDQLAEEQREFIRELLLRHERVTERLIRSLERTFSAIQAEMNASSAQIRANTEETRANTAQIRANTEVVFRLLDRLGPSDAPA